MRDHAPRPAEPGRICAADDCTELASVIGMMRVRVPGEYGQPSDLTHVHFEVPVCADHAALFRHAASKGAAAQTAAFETIRD